MRWSSAFSIFLLSFLFLAIATNGLKHDARDIERRQDASATGDDDAIPSETPETSSSSSETPTPTTSTEDEETPTPPPSTSSSSTSSTSTSSEEEPPETSTPPDPEPTTSEEEDPTPTTKEEEEEDKPTKRPTSSFVIVTKTVTSGSLLIPQEETSFVPGPTSEPGLGEDEGSQESSGLSTQTRNIIIGVVVGVGGAIILGGIAVVYYRLRRKRNARGPGDDDDLMHAGTAVGSHSHENSTSSSPFKSTLDQYHNPGPVNPASNF